MLTSYKKHRQFWNRQLWLLPMMIALCTLAQGQDKDMEDLASMHDERGFQQSAALSVDGKLAVSNSNGAVSYVYPISDFTVDNHKISTIVTYSPSVSFTAYKKHNPVRPGDQWDKTKQNRPAWIVGVNGFAVQVLATTRDYITSEREVCEFKFDGNDCYWGDQYHFDDRHLSWVVDGYDVCNRMDNLEDGNGDLLPFDQDKIHLLRADGSLLTLKNGTTRKNTQGQSIEIVNRQVDMFTGDYYVDEVNAAGYATVEIDDAEWARVRDLYSHFKLLSSVPDIDEYNFAPRRVRYYPGDGLCYEFREHVFPYGIQNIKEYPAEYPIGRMPTIFYLDNIAGASGKEVNFVYTRHNTHNLLLENPSRGRAALAGFTGHSFYYTNSGLRIDAMGRRHVMFYKAYATGGYDTFDPAWDFDLKSSMPLKTDAYDQADDDVDRNISYVGYVTKILDPEERAISFNYEKYIRKYVNFGFPKVKESRAPDVTLELANFRLNNIVQGPTVTDIAYHGQMEEELEATQYNNPQGNEANIFKAKYIASNMVAKIVRLDHSGVELCSLSTEDYLYDYSGYIEESSPGWNVMRILSDHKEGNLTATVHKYFRLDYDGIYENELNIGDRNSYTKLTDVYELNDDLITHTHNEYAQLPHPSVNNAPGYWGTTSKMNIYQTEQRQAQGMPPEPVFPISFIKVNTLTADLIDKSRVSFDYSPTYTRDFGDVNSSLANWFGLGLAKKSETVHRPDDASPLLQTETSYLHLSTGDFTASWIEYTWNKFKAIALWQSDPALQEKYQDSWPIDEPGAYDQEPVSQDVHFPYMTGLVTETLVRDPNDNDKVLQGKRFVYEQAYTSPAPDMLNMRGSLLEEWVVAEGDGSEAYKSAGYDYTIKAAKRWPGSIESANGATQKLFYNYWDYTGSHSPLATKIDNNNDAVDYLLKGRLPLVEDAVVTQSLPRYAHYDPGSGAVSILNRDIATYLERTYFGQISGIRDPNGYYSKSAYDKIGRLDKAWQIFDFPSDANNNAPVYENANVNLFTGNITKYTHEDMFYDINGGNHNDPNTSNSYYDQGVIENDYGDRMVAERPRPYFPDCVEGDDCEIAIPGSGRKSGDQVLVPGPFTEVFDVQREFYVSSYYRSHPNDVIQSAASIDEISLVLVPTAISGQNVVVSIEVFKHQAGDVEENAQALQSDIFLLNYGASKVQDVPLASLRLQIKDELLSEITSMASEDYIEFRIRNRTLGSSVEFGTSGQDSPHLSVSGQLLLGPMQSDYTLAYSYVDGSSPTATVSAKIDDQKHTEKTWDNQELGYSRFTETTHSFGANNRIFKSEQIIGSPLAPLRTDAVLNEHNGFGKPTVTTDQLGYETRIEYDNLGRVRRTEFPNDPNDPPGTVKAKSVSYEVGRPEDIINWGQPEHDYFGFCSATHETDENGNVTTLIFDAFDKLRHEIIKTPYNWKHVQYHYDLMGRMTKSVNPEHFNGSPPADETETRYYYDKYGRVCYKYQPDMGYVSFAYDKANNVRFVQSQAQADEGKMAFNQYDDLNRLTLVGEAYFGVPEGGGSGEVTAPVAGMDYKNQSANGDAIQSDASAALNLNRWTDLIDPDVLHNLSFADPLTVNTSIWNDSPPPNPVPQFPMAGVLEETDCIPAGVGMLPGRFAPPASYLKHPVGIYDRPADQAAAPENFEDAWFHPEFVRTVIYYDALPQPVGVIWGAFPAQQEWEQLMPKGVVRNLLGREVAKAYRQHAGEPFHYSVKSYDERGRVEALVRYTENLGFDAVYYKYNSQNQVIAVSSVTPDRQYNTFYGHDHNGRLECLWSYLTTPVFGLGISNPQYPVSDFLKPSFEDPVVVYSYDERHQIDGKQLPEAGVAIAYEYNARQWPTRTEATNANGSLFKQELSYDAAGNVVQQRSRNYGQLQDVVQDYTYYDQNSLATGELESWTYDDPNTSSQWSEVYVNDRMGNRMNVNHGGGVYELYSYEDLNGPNRLTTWTLNDDIREYDYNTDGALTQRRRLLNNGGFPILMETEHLRHGMGGLLEEYRIEPPTPMTPPTCPSPTVSSQFSSDWRYRYGPGGEREQKRLMYSEYGDECGNAHPWVYYQLGADNRQLAVYHGSQTTTRDCNNGSGPQEDSRAVYLYPLEFISYGAASVPEFLTRPSIGREYSITDHLGSTRLVIDQNGAPHSAMDYAPFGKAIPVAGAPSMERLSFIGKEQDIENELGDFGVRKYDDVTGRFTSIDPLWEKFRAWTPYHYSYGNPLRFVDPSGLGSSFFGPMSKDAIIDELKSDEDLSAASKELLILGVEHLDKAAGFVAEISAGFGVNGKAEGQIGPLKLELEAKAVYSEVKLDISNGAVKLSFTGVQAEGKVLWGPNSVSVIGQNVHGSLTFSLDGITSEGKMHNYDWGASVSDEGWTIDNSLGISIEATHNFSTQTLVPVTAKVGAKVNVGHLFMGLTYFAAGITRNLLDQHAPRMNPLGIRPSN